jgi:hypothetical protein
LIPCTNDRLSDSTSNTQLTRRIRIENILASFSISLIELFRSHSNDYDLGEDSKMIAHTIISSEWLTENCYIDTSSLISEYEDITSLHYCEVCRHYRPDWFKAYCYYLYNNNNNNNKNDNGGVDSNVSISGSGKINRRQITICTKCLDKYNHKEYERKLQRLERFVAENNACLNNSNGQRTVTIGGVIDIKTAHNAEDQIMLALKLVMNAKNNKKKNSVATTPAYNFDSDDGSDDNLFYDAVRMTYDQSEDVRRYFRNNPSRIGPNNAWLWPLRYQAYMQFGL